MRKLNRVHSRWALIGCIALIAIIILCVVFGHSGGTVSEPTPEPSNSPTAASTPTPEDDESIVWEDECAMGTVGAVGVYSNDTSLGCDLAYGVHITIGTDSGDENGLILAPRVSYDYARNPNERYGYIVRASSGELVCDTEPMPETSAELAGCSHLYIPGRTYDTLCSAENLRWVSSSSAAGGQNTSASIYIRAVRLSDGFLMGCARVNVTLDDNGMYRLSQLTRSDVSVTGELDNEVRDSLVAEAIQYIQSDAMQPILRYSDADYENVRAFIVVEKLPKPIYGKLFDSAGDVAPAGRFAGMDVYAVHLPYTGLGYVTVYFAPETQLTKVDAGDKLAVLGHDALDPRSAETMTQYLLPEDAEKFGLN